MKNILFILSSVLVLTLYGEQEPITITVKPSKKIKSEKEEKKESQQSGKKMVIFVSTSTIDRAGFGLALGLSASSKGVYSTIVLGGDAVRFALARGKQNLFLATQMKPRDMLLKAMELDGVVYISADSAEALGLKEEDFIEGVKIVEDDAIFSKVYEQDSKVLSF